MIQEARLRQKLPATQNYSILEALERQKEAERLHQEVVNQPGCPTTGDFVKAFGISANSIQVINPGLLLYLP